MANFHRYVKLPEGVSDTRPLRLCQSCGFPKSSMPTSRCVFGDEHVH